MRRVVIVSDSGAAFESLYLGVYNIKDKNFKKEFFSNEGSLVCIPFLESLIVFYKTFYPNNKEGLEKLMKLDDPYNIHIIYNSLLYDKKGNVKDEMKEKKWKNNNFLSSIYGREICAENFAIFVSESEIYGLNEVSSNEYEDFVKKVFEIVNVNKEALVYDYFNKVTYFINSDNVYSITDRAEVIEIKNKYENGEYGLFTDSIFLKEVNQTPYILLKEGLIAYVDEDNNYEYYFSRMNKKII